ncbi:MAG: UDP-N-acetylmuramate dehydrogenase [Pseudomonadota bacterium]|nr:UDP-N-acetylmuramate dehydrogenase [Pseudomonadota bacterium]
MTVVQHREEMIDLLPPVRGRYQVDVNLSSRSWFRTGGAAEVLFEPEDSDDLKFFLSERPAETAITVIGFGSNLLVRDGGVDGIVISLGEKFRGIAFNGRIIEAGAAALDVSVARAARENGIAGLEFLSGIPGTIGGGIRMNAGAYGGQISDIVIDANVLDANGGAHELNQCQLDFSYRRCAVPKDWVIVSARLQGEEGDLKEISGRMNAISAARIESQPRTRTGGSTFSNPPGHKAWELIDRAGCRGLKRGGAMVSEQHCNFMLNTGSATAMDLELLGEEVRSRVLKETGVYLEWEVRRIGKAPQRGEE